MFNVIKVQQEKLNELFAELNRTKNQKIYYEQRVNELLSTTQSVYSPVQVPTIPVTRSEAGV